MKIRLIGLGKMGYNMALNLRDHQHEVLGYDISEVARKTLSDQGIQTADTLFELFKRNPDERLIIWIFVPNQIVDLLIEQMMPYLN